MVLNKGEFIRRFLLHVPKPGLKVVRYYGLYASCKREELNQCRKELGQTEVKEPEKIEWQEYCKEKGMDHPESCPVCGKDLIKGKEFEPGDGMLLRLKLNIEDRKRLV